MTIQALVQRRGIGHAGPGNMLLNELFQLDEEGGVGVVAANKKMAADPRYSMSMTADIKPGETQTQAKKFGNSVDKMGLPPKLKTNGQVSEAVMSATIQGRNPIGAGARGLMGARWKYGKVVKEAEVANLKNAVASLAEKVPDVEKVNYDSVDSVMQEICHKYNIDPKDLHHAFKNKYKLTPDAYSIKVKHERNNKHKSI